MLGHDVRDGPPCGHVHFHRDEFPRGFDERAAVGIHGHRDARPGGQPFRQPPPFGRLVGLRRQQRQFPLVHAVERLHDAGRHQVRENRFHLRGGRMHAPDHRPILCPGHDEGPKQDGLRSALPVRHPRQFPLSPVVERNRDRQLPARRVPPPERNEQRIRFVAFRPDGGNRPRVLHVQGNRARLLVEDAGIARPQQPVDFGCTGRHGMSQLVVCQHDGPARRFHVIRMDQPVRGPGFGQTLGRREPRCRTSGRKTGRGDCRQGQQAPLDALSRLHPRPSPPPPPSRSGGTLAGPNG